ncbi:TetR/AcrR family transcriptional regulator [Streptomyces naganishii]|uniref:TetR family transcriptional regulator n=1 Tax=Streptomyces naganishii JCM 4654 TaxID=1306179 RepID=A0A918Y278_9ACTN|nr:TetR/AcrR family transcriptional regulator [Streptomyces naganishii]GHD87118.1 TetR family transcriptional regulator [Streptomyces naganishii JCM 4654]
MPISRRERPAKPALTREGIIDTALRLMDEEGLQRVTMRRLAQALDTGPASLYVYVANTAELHAAILDRLLGQVDLAAAGDEEGWRERLHTVLVSYTRLLFAHPSLAQSALVARPSGPHYLDLVETLLRLLDEGGVPADQAAWGVDILLQSATAAAAEHSSRDESARTEEEWRRLDRALATASPDTHPHIHALAADLVSGTPGERSRWTIDMLINGILTTPRAQGPRSVLACGDQEQVRGRADQ